MKVVEPGHVYKVTYYDGETGQSIPLQTACGMVRFVSRKPFHEPAMGTINQELLRVLIDRVQVLDAETPWEGNKEIIFCLRRALLLHEIRALERKLEKGKLNPEKVFSGPDGHFMYYGDTQ